MKKKVLLILIIFFISHSIYSQWYIQNYSVNPINYCITNDGRIFLTHDGVIYSSSTQGQSWKNLNVFTYRILSSFFMDSLNGYCYTTPAYDPFQLYRTTNSGITWNLMYTNTSYSTPISRLHFINNTTGWGCWGGRVFGGSFASGWIVKTTSGGTSWQQQFYSEHGLTSIYMLNANTGYVTSYDTLLRTTNGGMNWTTKYLGYDLCKVKFINILTGFVLSNNFVLYKTTDGGINWIENSLNIAGGMSYDFSFVNENTGWIGTGGNYIYKTTNSGFNWVREYSGPNSNYNVKSIVFLNQNTGFAGVDNGKVLKTTNSGINWSYQYDTFDDDNYGIFIYQ